MSKICMFLFYNETNLFIYSEIYPIATTQYHLLNKYLSY